MLFVHGLDYAVFQRHTLISDIRRTLRMGAPLIAAQLLAMCNGLVDSIVAGRLGRDELGAGGLGAGIWFFVSLLSIGLMAGLSPILSELIGNRRRNYVGEVFRQGLWLALAAGALGCASLLLVRHFLHLSSLQPELIPHIKTYLLFACWSLPAFAIMLAARNVCEATHITKPVLWVQAFGLLVNVIVDLTLGLGLFGFPKMGMAGIGLATSLVMICMAIALLWLLRGPTFKRYNLFAQIEPPKWLHIRPILVISIPIFLGLAFEAGLFVATAIQSGMISSLASSAHVIAIGATSFMFMLPLGLSFAVTARIGRVYGAGRLESLKLRLVSGICICVGMAVLTASFLVIFRSPIAQIYTNDIEVQQVAVQLMLLAAVFQLSDGLQVTLIGILRGLQDTNVPMLINAFAYWAIAFGSGYYLAHNAGYGIFGLWGGLIIGLSVAATMLAFRLRFVLNRVMK